MAGPVTGRFSGHVNRQSRISYNIDKKFSAELIEAINSMDTCISSCGVIFFPGRYE